MKHKHNIHGERWQEIALKTRMTPQLQEKTATVGTPLTSQTAPKRKQTPEVQSNMAKKPKSNQVLRAEVIKAPLSPANESKLVKKRVKEKTKPRAATERADALAVEASSGSTYAEILKKVKNGLDLKSLGDTALSINDVTQVLAFSNPPPIVTNCHNSILPSPPRIVTSHFFVSIFY